ncbi:C4-dicarboxylate ABC transporter [Celeribacter ethanolicus]|uniref:C4-dicarboxylate ABC transporter n=1 Tax=Celeribacter ethanolicus TaxID=1758178 RepID=A0A291GDN0_9RHOB|nr:TRAP transporter substrate-binding protein [Celeribacter ethanolicus]ATG48653.1 C4-dicarboxylate ABC transporter [Celeribacter ethanolicus]
MNSLLKTVALAALVSVTGTLSAAAQEVTLRFQHFVSPKAGSATYFMEPWARKVEKDSGGRIKVEIYPLMQLGGKAPDQYDLIRDGAIDGGWIIPGYQPGRFPETEAIELPFVSLKSAELSSMAAWEFTQEHLLDDFSDIHILAAHTHGEGLVHKKGEPIRKVEDFEGLKLRAPTRTSTLLLEKMGATPVGLPVPAFPEALSKGVLDGGIITFAMSPSLKLDELTDAETDVAGDRSFYNLYFLWAMNKAKYDSLPDDLKEVIDRNSGLMASRWSGIAYDMGDDDGVKVIEASDNAVNVLSEEETAKITALGDEVVADWIAEMDEKGFDGEKLVADVKAAMERAQDAAPWVDARGAAYTIATE